RLLARCYEARRRWRINPEVAFHARREGREDDSSTEPDVDATTDSVEARVAEQLAAINRLEAAVASAGAPETSTVGVGLKDKLYDFTSARLLEILASLNRADPERAAA